MDSWGNFIPKRTRLISIYIPYRSIKKYLPGNSTKSTSFVLECQGQQIDITTDGRGFVVETWCNMVIRHTQTTDLADGVKSESTESEVRLSKTRLCYYAPLLSAELVAGHWGMLFRP